MLGCYASYSDLELPMVIESEFQVLPNQATSSYSFMTASSETSESSSESVLKQGETSGQNQMSVPDALQTPDNDGEKHPPEELLPNAICGGLGEETENEVPQFELLGSSDGGAIALTEMASALTVADKKPISRGKEANSVLYRRNGVVFLLYSWSRWCDKDFLIPPKCGKIPDFSGKIKGGKKR